MNCIWRWIINVIVALIFLGVNIVSGSDGNLTESNASAVVTECGIATNGFQLCIYSKKLMYQTNEIIHVTFCFKNVGSEAVRLYGGTVSNCRYSVADTNGVAVALTPYGVELKKNPMHMGSFSWRRFEPSDVDLQTYNLSKIYNLATPGTYLISATYTVPEHGDHKRCELRSNVLQVIVTNSNFNEAAPLSGVGPIPATNKVNDGETLMNGR